MDEEQMRSLIHETIEQVLRSQNRMNAPMTEHSAEAGTAGFHGQAAPPSPKPEHMTHLRGDHLVFKDHPRIAFRGAVDSLESEIILLQILTEKKGLHTLTADLAEIIQVIRRLLRCEVSGEAAGEICLQNLSADELRAHSHHPSQYYGMKHFLPDYQKGEIPAHLNHLRTKAREAELTACHAFKREDGSVEREDILRVLNRLSSLFWIMMFKYLTGKYGQERNQESACDG